MAKNETKIFLKFYNVALCGIKNKCIWAYSELFIFIRSRDMAINGKYFEILQRSIHCAAFKIDAFRPIRSFLISSEAEICQKRKNIFEILQRIVAFKINEFRSILSSFSSEAEIWPKTKIFLKFYNVALCGIKIDALGLFESFIFIRSRDMAKNEKKYFEILQRSIVRHSK
ncbi:hypothetical protein PUN28_020608 [Cardiocondyla obscurior]|uniref:Uncharacterized protein n=1 Tax=Cardiocondyla obscurior TaxID=286306 RepID=A0AAW2EAH5_9HYME